MSRTVTRQQDDDFLKDEPEFDFSTWELAEIVHYHTLAYHLSIIGRKKRQEGDEEVLRANREVSMQ